GDGGGEVVPVTQDQRERVVQQAGTHVLDDVPHPVGQHRRGEPVRCVARLERGVVEVLQGCCFGHDSGLPDTQLAVAADGGNLAGDEEGGGQGLADDGGAGDLVARTQGVPLVL